MPSGVQVASLFGVLSLDDSNFKSGLTNAKTGLSGLGDNLKSAGAQITTLSAPLAGVFTLATNQAMAFDEAVTNTGAVMGLTRDQITALSSELLSIGGDSVQGPQAVAESFYDIVGGVADASTHMAILRASIDTATAGNANLQGTTQALISTMNSYGFAADQAGMVSDVLTQIVGKGVGTMDQFASALPQVTGLAASLGIPLEDVGGAMAFLTTKGNSASEASTQLGAIMSAMMKPNADMIAALQEMGFSSGSLAIEQLGLVGAIQAVSTTSTAGTQGMAALLGTQEAVRGSVSLMSEGFAGFQQTFTSTVDGVTSKAQEIQMGGPAAQFELLKSQASELAITAGTALIPALMDIVAQARPVIDTVVEWIGQNPELTAQIGMLAIGGTVLGGGLLILGTIFSGVSAAVGLLTAGVTFLLSPVGLLIAGIAGIIFAANSLYPGGIAQLFLDAANSARMLAQIFVTVFGPAIQSVSNFIAGLVTGLIDAINRFSEFLGLAGVSDRAGIAGVINDRGARVLAARAAGGPVTAGSTYLVGENGPELFTPVSSGNISSNRDTMGMMGGIQIGSIVINANTRAGGEAAMDGALARLNARGR